MAHANPEFDYIRDLLLQESGISMDCNKEYLIETRLSTTARKFGFSNTKEFIASVRKGGPKSELAQAAVDALTTNETSFFRDSYTFQALRDSILPELVSSKGSSRSLSIWSAACSTGQEIYSLAILIAETFPELSGWKIRLLATDLSPTVLERARTGLYTDFELKRGLSEAMRDKYFNRIDEHHWQLQHQLRSKVQFEQRNLIEPWPGLGKFDLVLLRNVLIYFELTHKRAILNQIKDHLHSGAHLVLGSSETTYNIDAAWAKSREEKSISYQLNNAVPEDSSLKC